MFTFHKKMQAFFALILFILLFGTSSSFGAILDTDTFDSDKDGWAGSNVTYEAGKLRIDRDDIASKIFTFPGYENQTVTFELEATEIDVWEESGYWRDRLEIWVNDSLDGREYYISETVQITFEATLDKNGSVAIKIKPNTTANTEDVYIDNILITGDELVLKQPIVKSIENQNLTFKESFFFDISSYVIPNGGAISSYNLTGTLPTGVSFNASSGVLHGASTDENDIGAAFDLLLTATNEYGVSNQESFTLTVVPNIIESLGGRDFQKREQQSVFGDVKVIGNTVLCHKDSGNNCIESPENDSNADVNLQKVAESSAQLIIPNGANITYARIYWQGRKKATHNSTNWDDASKTNASTIEIRKGSVGEFISLTADIKDFDEIELNGNYIRVYSASADAKNIVDSNGTYYINPSSFDTHASKTLEDNPSDGLGNYGAWVLVIIYHDPNDTKARNITIFDGYKQVTSSSENVDINVNGFLTPKSGSVDSSAYVFAAEGDKYISGDIIKMAGVNHSATLQDIGTFDSKIDIPTTRNPNLNNNNGIDIHKYNTGTDGLNIIRTNEVGAKFQFTSTEDTYFPSLIVFSTELYLPQLCYDYSIKQDGQYFFINRATCPIAHIYQTIATSDLEIGVYLINQEADIAVQGIAIKSDVNDSVFTMDNNISTSNTNGAVLINRGTPNYSSPLCEYSVENFNETTNSGCTNGHDIRKGLGTLETNDYIYLNYTLTPQNLSGALNDVNESLGLSLKYYITANGEKIEYPDHILGGPNIPFCNLETGYIPTWGIFNVIKDGQTGSGVDLKNNIETQVANKPFSHAVVFDNDTSTGINDAPISEFNSTVMVEIIDVDSFGNIDASCANPASRVSVQKIFIPVDFSPSNYQASIPPQNPSYYNFAVKNAAYRIWYFKKPSDDSLIQGWSANTSNNGLILNSISGLYQGANEHSLCINECDGGFKSSTGCFNCIYANYSSALCSRDNFSVRPESYDIRIFDVNQTASPAIKESTKIDLSSSLGYSPDSATISSIMNLAAGYNYRYDINSTSHTSLGGTPGYTRSFSSTFTNDYNATLLWNPPINMDDSNCNDTGDIYQNFYIANGQMVNTEASVPQAGEYLLHIKDSTWTAVDWDSSKRTHQIAANGFTTGSADCDTLSTTTNPSGSNKVGCTITSNHTNTAPEPNHVYKDINISFKPYRFNIGSIEAPIVFSRMADNNTTLNNSFVYTANVDENSSQKMALNIIGSIVPEGFNGSTLSNFTSGCFAEDIDLTLNRMRLDNAFEPYRARFIDTNSTGGIVTDFVSDVNDSTLLFSITDGNFTMDNNGILPMQIYLNFSRETNTSRQPIRVRFDNFNVTCTTSTNCQFNANLISNQEANGTRDLNGDILNHYYGRVFAPEYQGVNPIMAQVYYEVYCNGCNRSDFNITRNPSVDSTKWFINTHHNDVNQGSVNDFNSIGSTELSKNTTGIGNISNGFENIILTEVNDKVDYIEMTPSNWLIFNQFNPTTTTNGFWVEFTSEGAWAGEGTVKKDANNINVGAHTHATDDNTTLKRENRRINW